MIDITSNISNLFKYYKTVNASPSSRLEPQTTSINGRPFLLVPNDNSFCIYNLQDLSLQFMGPFFKNIECIGYSGHRVFVGGISTSDFGLDNAFGKLYVVVRSEIVETHEISGGAKKICLCGEYLVVLNGNNEICVYDICDDSVILKFLHKIVISKTCECGENDILQILHPYGHKNKVVVVCSDGTMILLNVRTHKEIFRFNIGKKIFYIEQTSVADILGLFLSDGTVRLFNIRKNSIVFDIVDYKDFFFAECEKAIINNNDDKYDKYDNNNNNDDKDNNNNNIDDKDNNNNNNNNDDNNKYDNNNDDNNKYDNNNNDDNNDKETIEKKHPPIIKLKKTIKFHGSFMLVVIGGRLGFYDLEIKKEVFFKDNSKEEIFFGSFINDDVFLVVSTGGIFLYNIEDFTVLKSRKIFSGGVDHVVGIDDRKFVVSGDAGVFRVDVYCDEQNCYLKSIENITAIDGDENGLVISGDNSICVIDRIGKFRKVADTRAEWVKTYGDFLMFGRDKRFFVMNNKSGRVCFEGTEEHSIIAGHFDHNRAVLLTTHEIVEYTCENLCKQRTVLYNLENLNLNTEMKIVKINDNKIFTVGNIIVAKIKNTLIVIFGEKHRTYPCDAFCIEHTDNPNKMLGVTYGAQFFLYDLVSGTLIEHITASLPLTHILLIGQMRFILLVDSQNNIHLLSNNSLFVKLKNAASLAALSGYKSSSTAPLAVSRIKGTFTEELAVYKTLPVNNDLAIKGLTENEVFSILAMIEKDIINNCDFSLIRILNKILTYKGKIIKEHHIKNIKQIIKKFWNETDIRMISALGNLTIGKNTI